MLVAETIVYSMLALSAARLRVGTNRVQSDTDCTELVFTNDEADMPQLMVADSLDTALAKDLASVEQVQHVFVETVADAMLLWIAVDNPERLVRERIFEKELELMDAFPEINFDFNLIPTMGRPIGDIVTGARAVYSRQS